MLNLDFKGENILHNESIVIVTPHVLAPIVQNIMVNQIGINQFQIVHEESNEIRIYRVSYLYSPHYIREIYGLNPHAFIQLVREQRYSPFTDKKYMSEYAKKGDI